MDPLLSTLLMVAVMMIVFNLLISRPAKKKAAEQAAAIAAMEPGARVMTTAGVFGTVRHMGERQAIIEISPGVEMTILRQAISKAVTADEEEFEYDDEEGLAETLDPDAAAAGLAGATIADAPSSADALSGFARPAEVSAVDPAFDQAIAGYTGPDAVDPQELRPLSDVEQIPTDDERPDQTK